MYRRNQQSVCHQDLERRSGIPNPRSSLSKVKMSDMEAIFVSFVSFVDQESRIFDRCSSVGCKNALAGKELAGSLDGSRTAERMEMMVAMSVLQYVLVGLAAVAGGLVNALAGGGTLITF